MWTRITDWWELRQAQRQVAADPVFLFALQWIETNWSDNPLIKGVYSKEFVQRHAAELQRRAVLVVTAEDRVAANRQELCGMSIDAARAQVLFLPAEPAADETGLRGRLGITGTLRKHHRVIRETNKVVRELTHALPDDVGDHDLFGFIQCWYHQQQTTSLFHSAIRVALNDYNAASGKDWYQPLFLCLCAHAEHTFRTDAGLPSLIETIRALQLSTIVDFVMTGERWPDLAWELHYGERIPRLT